MLGQGYGLFGLLGFGVLPFGGRFFLLLFGLRRDLVLQFLQLLIVFVSQFLQFRLFVFEEFLQFGLLLL